MIPEPNNTQSTSSELSAQDFWTLLESQVHFESDEESTKEQLLAEPQIIQAIIKALEKTAHQERHFKLSKSGNSIFLYWHDEEEKPTLCVEHEESAVSFLEQFSQNYRQQHAAAAQNKGHRKSLSDLAFARSNHVRIPYMCLDGSDE